MPCERRWKCGDPTTRRADLYEGLGFRLAGVRQDYYTDPVEDALILWRDPVGSPTAGQNG